MKKRVMSALLALYLCLPLLPGAAFAAYEPLVEVDAVSVRVPAPTVEDGLEVPTVAGDAPYFIDSLYAPDDIDTNFFTGIVLPPRAATLLPAISMRKAGPAL